MPGNLSNPLPAAPSLSDYLEINGPGSPRVEKGAGELASVGLSCKIPLSQWPEALRQKWKQELFFLFPGEKKLSRGDSRDHVVLCHEVTNCPKKLSPEEEDRSCPYYNQGICILATTSANHLRPLSFGTIGAFNGISKQRVQQIYCAAQKKVIRAAAQDPILREYYTNLGLRPENMPDPKKIASDLDSLLRKT